MSRQRRKYTKYSSELKAEVAVAALKGEQTTSALAAHYGLDPTMVSQWKRELRNNAIRVFERKSTVKTTKNSQEEIDTLNCEIRKLSEKLDSLVTLARSLSRSHQELDDTTPPK